MIKLALGEENATQDPDLLDEGRDRSLPRRGRRGGGDLHRCSPCSAACCRRRSTTTRRTRRATSTYIPNEAREADDRDRRLELVRLRRPQRLDRRRPLLRLAHRNLAGSLCSRSRVRDDVRREMGDVRLLRHAGRLERRHRRRARAALRRRDGTPPARALPRARARRAGGGLPQLPRGADADADAARLRAGARRPGGRGGRARPLAAATGPVPRGARRARGAAGPRLAAGDPLQHRPRPDRGLGAAARRSLRRGGGGTGHRLLQARARALARVRASASAVAPERHVHVAASLFHDIVPATELGLTSVWINRLGERAGPRRDSRPGSCPTCATWPTRSTRSSRRRSCDVPPARPLPRLPHAHRRRGRAPRYECHVCGRVFAAGLVRVPRAWGAGGEAMAEAAAPRAALPGDGGRRGGDARRADARARRGAARAAARARRLLLRARRRGRGARCPCAAALGGRLAGRARRPEHAGELAVGELWGMPLRMLLDAGAVAAGDVALVGARNLDPPEEEFIAASGLRTGVEGVDRRARGRRARLRRARLRRRSTRRRSRASCPSRAGSRSRRPSACCARSPRARPSSAPGSRASLPEPGERRAAHAPPRRPRACNPAPGEARSKIP